MNTLVLWDIDLTLIDARGLGHTWYRTALHAVAGLDLVHTPSFPGRTERAITQELLISHDLEPTEELIARLHAELIDVATREHTLLPSRGHVLPGASAALEALARQEDVVQSLVTGNLVEIARYKLAAFGLDTHLDFEIGGYGSISEHRPELVLEAVRLASAKHGKDFEAVVIGDTPHDVDAALHHSAFAIGVATGRSSVAELRAAGAHVVLEDLADTAAVLAAVLER
ncbi:phosphoglycolate phosphatase-like HAD superfamily hydrolase [Saccharothrix tamanrassetensis]|uniref:Phosphoglycolate phosphatase-like HAD superfamily hydrolase n=1 Tax=Saccharothrix tamanrassetensis TaxID=1051531 RepID=A0A841CGZ2_9PSEU|nr:haloacid dehalogenase-like hydrolase [Saccharothrix tamanrassetensis]MBB5955634.1 phosphoglycolate phosphatase-like HAD superfamily hydrolase [Saccharothrix tamanrassetensis]